MLPLALEVITLSPGFASFDLCVPFKFFRVVAVQLD